MSRGGQWFKGANFQDCRECQPQTLSRQKIISRDCRRTGQNTGLSRNIVKLCAEYRQSQSLRREAREETPGTRELVA